MKNEFHPLANAFQMSINEIAHIIGYTRGGLYAKRPNPERDRVSKKVLIMHSDMMYEQDILRAERNKKVRESEIEKMFRS